MRKDYKKLMVIGSGPIVIGQAAEFDFSGTQACRSLKEEGYSTVLVNSNPATIQTDTDTADSVYIEPLEAANIAKIIEREGVDGVLSGMGGQTALNICSELADSGELERLGCSLVGTQPDAIAMSEDRELFKETMERIGEPVPVSRSVNTIEEAKEAVKIIGRYPVLVRPAYTLGGTGGGIAHNEEELEEICARGLAYSRIHQVLIEESVLGWKEYEYEVMRDSNDNCIIICNMENLDAMGIHTGESIVVAPCLTLSDTDHQRLRTAALKVIRALNIEGGCNVQFAFDPANGDYRLIEVNPRVSRSSALASKATGYPIARVATKIAVGYTLDEIPNRITGTTCAAFEPSIDYVVIKIPRWPFDKFRTVDRHLGTQMKSTGEVMSIGRTFEEALLKGLRSLEIGVKGLDRVEVTDDEIREELVNATDKRIFVMAEALRKGWSPEEVADLAKWDIFFVKKLLNVVDMEKRLAEGLTPEVLKEANSLIMGKAFLDLGSMFALVEVKDDSVKLDSVYKATQQLKQALDDKIKHFIDSCNNRMAITYVIGDFVAKNYPFEEVERYYDNLTPEVKASYPGQLLAENMKALREINVGGIAPDIDLATPAGGHLKLSSLRGKYVLLDFWASWCGPCLAEVPNVKAIYEEYKDKGFEIYGVSLDEDAKAWKNAIEKHGLTWLHVSSLKGWECPVAKRYNVTGIPKMYLLDKEGRIIAMDLRGEALKEKVSSLFNE